MRDQKNSKKCWVKLCVILWRRWGHPLTGHSLRTRLTSGTRRAETIPEPTHACAQIYENFEAKFKINLLISQLCIKNSQL